MSDKITAIHARSILDSRGMPTVHAVVTLADGTTGEASVPSGASTGTNEAVELRDGGGAYGGKGVTRAVANVNGVIAAELTDIPASAQRSVDEALIALDGTPNKARLGANAMLAVSVACCRAAANHAHTPLFRYLGGANARLLPVPMLNILNGGAHARNNIDIQEFMIRPIMEGDMRARLRAASEIYRSLGRLLREKGLACGVGDEGGYAPDLDSDEAALTLLTEAIADAGYRPGDEVTLALDIAAGEWVSERGYKLPKRGEHFSREGLMDHYTALCEKYPIDSIEDPLGEEDFDGFAMLTKLMGHKLQIVGDDLFTTNPRRLRRGIASWSANAILIKPNQIGTVTETLDTVRLAQRHGYRTVISHRSGETEDTFIADLAVAVNAGQIKAGAPARTDRTCKYNRLLAIEDMLD